MKDKAILIFSMLFFVGSALLLLTGTGILISELFVTRNLLFEGTVLFMLGGISLISSFSLLFIFKVMEILTKTLDILSDNKKNLNNTMQDFLKKNQPLQGNNPVHMMPPIIVQHGTNPEDEKALNEIFNNIFGISGMTSPLFGFANPKKTKKTLEEMTADELKAEKTSAISKEKYEYAAQIQSEIDRRNNSVPKDEERGA